VSPPAVMFAPRFPATVMFPMVPALVNVPAARSPVVIVRTPMASAEIPPPFQEGAETFPIAPDRLPDPFTSIVRFTAGALVVKLPAPPAPWLTIWPETWARVPWAVRLRLKVGRSPLTPATTSAVAAARVGPAAT